MTIALVLGGGAPNLTLMAGAVAALDDAGVEFDVVSTSGAGMLIGLLYAAPKGRDIKRDRAAALKNTVNMGVHDAIYRFFPVNFKVFHKPGTLAQAYTKFWQIAADDREAIEGPVGDFRDQWLQVFVA
jgi:NTE family protein